MYKRLLLLLFCSTIFTIGNAQTLWTGKYKLAYHLTNKNIFYLQIVPDNTGNGDIADAVVYIKLPANTSYTKFDLRGNWTVQNLSTGLSGDTDCGMVVECKLNAQYPATNAQNTISFNIGTAYNFIRFELTSSSCGPDATYRLYEDWNSTSTTDPCTNWLGRYLANGLTVETDSHAYTGNLTNYSNPLTCANSACAWKTIRAGDWSEIGYYESIWNEDLQDYDQVWHSGTIWEYYDCTLQSWIASPVPPNNDEDIYIYHNVDIPFGTTINTGSIINIESTGKLDVCGTLDVSNQIVFKLDASGNAGELNNCGCTSGGSVVMGSEARRIVRRPAGSAWSFISFPFDVYEDNIFEAETTTPVIWGDLSSATAQLFAVEYDGQKQATDNVNGVTPATSNFVNVDDVIGADRVLLANKGYLVTNDKKRLLDIDFTSVSGTQFNFCDPVTTDLTLYTATVGEETSDVCSEGWNFVGLPYTSSYDLNDAITTSGSQFQIYQSGQYVNSLLNPTNILYPFSAFFVQVHVDPASIEYAILGQQNIKGVQRALTYDNVLLEFSNGINTDRTSIRLKEDAFAGLDYKEDGAKMMSGNAAFPQIYTEIPEACPKIAVNTLPADTQRVDLKVRTGTVGTYTIKLTDAAKAPGLKKIVLVDAFTGIRTDLLQTESYTYENTETGTSDRFYILFSNDGTTGINIGNNDGISIITKGKNLNFSGLKGVAHVNMYDVVGKLIYQYSDIANNQSFDVDIPGVYMVDISTETQKARIKVLINDRD